MGKFLEGGKQTTINSTITELFPTLAFNNNQSPNSAEKMQGKNLAHNSRLHNIDTKIKIGIASGN